MRLVDYIAEKIYQEGVRHVFMVTGGGMMFLSDAVEVHPGLEAVCTHHEQAAAMAAVSYAKYNENLGACFVTTGCGGTNAVTGLLNGWQDNIPTLFVSGQCKRKETTRNSELKLRGFGVQEADIIAVVESLTKYAVMVNKPELIAYHLEKAIFLARHGRPGPVWLDIPLDVQNSQVEPANLVHFSPEECTETDFGIPTNSEISLVAGLLEKAERPVVLAGQGIRLGKALAEFKNFIEKFQVPYVATTLTVDLLPAAHPLFIGRIGNKGDRPGNFAVQNADLVLSVGCRLCVSSTGHEYNLFARKAKLVVIDIDPVEHRKNTVRIDNFILADAKLFLTRLGALQAPPARQAWLDKCSHWKQKYPVCQPEYANSSEGINLYYFVDCLSKLLKPGGVVVSDAGSSFYATTQAVWLKEGQRYITSGGQAEMGYTMPATIGVSFALNKGEVMGITGDGSFQTNIQEMQTIVHHNLPIKTFVWNNDGYLSIRATQRKFFQGRFIGTDSQSGVSFPSLEKIAGAYGMKFFRLESSRTLLEDLKPVLDFPGPVLCEVMCIRDQEIVPAVSALQRPDGTLVSRPLEDMYPFLDREEFRSEMVIEPLEE